MQVNHIEMSKLLIFDTVIPQILPQNTISSHSLQQKTPTQSQFY